MVISTIVQKRRTWTVVSAQSSKAKVASFSHIVMGITCSRRLYVHHLQQRSLFVGRHDAFLEAHGSLSRDTYAKQTPGPDIRKNRHAKTKKASSKRRRFCVARKTSAYGLTERYQ